MHSLLRQIVVWLPLSCLTGCATPGVISVRDMPAEHEAPALQPVKILDFAKLARPYDQQRRIVSGDLLEVTCSNLLKESKTGTVQVRVDAEGFATLPLLPNPVLFDSLTCGEAEQTVNTAYRTSNLIKQPNTSIKIVEFLKKKVYIVGAVKNPGMYELRPDECNPLRAILAAGGLTEEAGAVVEIRRTGNGTPARQSPQPPPEKIVLHVSQWAVDQLKAEPSPAVSTVRSELVAAAPFAVDRTPVAQTSANEISGPDLYHTSHADSKGQPTKAPDSSERSSNPESGLIRFDLAGKSFQARPDQLVLNNGDVVHVEEKKKLPLYVTGSVKRPGDFPVPTDREIHVLEAIGMAGGVNTLSQPTKALITRRLADHEPVVLSVDLQSAVLNPKENIRLTAGDVVSVEEDWASQTRRFFREFIKLGVNSSMPGLN